MADLYGNLPPMQQTPATPTAPRNPGGGFFSASGIAIAVFVSIAGLGLLLHQTSIVHVFGFAIGAMWFSWWANFGAFGGYLRNWFLINTAKRDSSGKLLDWGAPPAGWAVAGAWFSLYIAAGLAAMVAPKILPLAVCAFFVWCLYLRVRREALRK